jgi:flagellar motor component MotA
MNDDEFTNEYNNFVERVYIMSDKARREGLLAIEEMIDENKYIHRDVFEYGLRLVIDGTDAQFIKKILTNIIELEDDKNKKLLKNIQQEAVLAIQEGLNPRLLMLLLNSYVNINTEETMKKYSEI